MSTTPPEDTNPSDTPPPPAAPDYGQGYGQASYGSGATPPPPPPAGPAGDGWSVGDALSYGWAKFQAYVGPSIILALIILVTAVIFGGIGFVIRAGITTTPHFDSSGNFHDGSGFLVSMVGSAITSALSFLAQTAAGAVLVRGALDVSEGRAPAVGDILGRIPWAKVIVLGLIQALLIFVGFVLCFVPGIIAAFLFYFATYYVIDQGLEPVDALRASVSLTTKNLGSALVWAIVGSIVAFLGFCLCGVGALVTLPLVAYGTAYTFKKLTGQAVAA